MDRRILTIGILALILVLAGTASGLWWNSSVYGYAAQIHKNSTGYYGVVVNDTHGVGGVIYHTLIDNASKTYIACTETGFTGSCAIVNETGERPWFNGTNGTGYSVSQVYENATLVMTFDQNAGKITEDFSGLGNDGECYGSGGNLCNWTSRSKFGYALEFDGVDDYVSISSSESVNFGSKPFTIEFWMNTTSTSKYEGVINIYDGGSTGWYISLGSIIAGKIFMFLGDGSNYRGFDLATTVNDGKWHHVVFTRNTTNTTGFVDGVEDFDSYDWSVGDEPFDITGTHNLILGEESNYYYPGFLDEVRLYNRTLSATEIQEHYQSGINNRTYLGAEESALVADWVNITAISIHPSLLYTDTDATLYTIVNGTNDTYRIEFFWEVGDVIVSHGNVSGVSNNSNTSIDTLAASNYDVGQTVNASVKAYISATVYSTTNSTQKTVLNRPITITAIGWNASVAYSNNSLSCNVTADFGDNSTGFVEYFISNATTLRYSGNSTISNNTNSAIFNLSAHIIYKGDIWYCNASASDGRDWSHQHEYNSTNIWVSNSFPVCSSTAQSITLGLTDTVTPGTCTDADYKDTLTWGSNLTAAMCSGTFATNTASSFYDPYSTLVGTHNISLNCTDSTDTGQCPYILTVSNCSAVAVETVEKERFILRYGGQI